MTGTGLAREDVAGVVQATPEDLAPFLELAGEHRRRLAVAVSVHAGRVLAAVGFQLDAPPIADGMLVWDARFASHLEQLGSKGRELAGRIRERASSCWVEVAGDQLGLFEGPEPGFETDEDLVRRQARGASLRRPELWWLWERREPPLAPRWFLALAEAVWLEEVKPAIDREAARKFPALPLPFAEAVAGLRRAAVSPDGLVDDRGGASPLVPIGPGDLSELAVKGLDQLDTPTADRLFGWLLRLGCELEAEDPLRPANMYSRRIVGGFAAIARELGFANNKAPTEIRELVAALGATWVAWDVPGVGNGRALPLVHLRDEQHRRPGRPESFVLGLSPVWTPKLAPALTGTARLLVPWLPLPDLEGVNSRHQRGAVLLWRGVRVELRLQANRLDRGGAILDWMLLADQAGLPARAVPELVAKWTSLDGPLVNIGSGVDVRDPVLRAVLLEGGARQRKRQAAGRASARGRKPRKP